MKRPTCADCAYFTVINGVPTTCRRFAPETLVLHDELVSRFPITNADIPACGDFAREFQEDL